MYFFWVPQLCAIFKSGFWGVASKFIMYSPIKPHNILVALKKMMNGKTRSRYHSLEESEVCLKFCRILLGSENVFITSSPLSFRKPNLDTSSSVTHWVLFPHGLKIFFQDH